MSGPESLPPDDHELADFLGGRGPHRARYRLASQEQSPAAVDATVLAQARAAVEAHTAPRRVRNRASWRLPLSLAATLVLGVGLSTRVLRETPAVPGAQAPAGAARVAVSEAADQPAPAASDELPTVAAAATPAAGTRSVLAESEEPAAAAKARIAEQLARSASEHEGVEREFAKREQPLRQAMAAPSPEAMGPAPSPTSVPPASVMAAEQSIAGPAASAASVAGMAMSDSTAPPPPPVAAMAAPAAPAEVQATRRATMPAFATQPAIGLAGRYRAESGFELELFSDGRFTLSSPGTYPAIGTLSGRRQAEAGAERLVPDAGTASPCALWLQSPASAGLPDSVELRSDCESGYAGVYRRETAEPGKKAAPG